MDDIYTERKGKEETVSLTSHCSLPHLYSGLTAHENITMGRRYVGALWQQSREGENVDNVPFGA